MATRIFNVFSPTAYASANVAAPNSTALIAWAGGFADGEACVGLSKQHLTGRKNPTYRLRLEISQNHLGCLAKFASALGINPTIYLVNRTTQHNKQVYTMPVCDAHAYRALGLLLPHLERKRDEALVARQAYIDGQLNVHPGCAGFPPEIWKLRERFYKKLRRMK